MAWNEPGGGRNDDPWGDRKDDPWGRGRGNDQGPPDVDEALRLRYRLIGAELAACGREIDAIVEHWLPKDRFSTHDEARSLEVEWSSRSIAAFRARIVAASGRPSLDKAEVRA